METSLLLDMASGDAPERRAVTGGHVSLSFAELATRARAAATWFAEQEGTKLVFVGLNGVDLPVAIFASAYAGLPFVPLNYRLADADLKRLLARTAPAVAVVDDDMLLRTEDVPGITYLPRSAFESLGLDPQRRAADLVPAEPAIAVLLFTSGTTGEPKAAVLRHTNLTSYVISTVEFMGSDESEAALVCVPPYHIAGISAVLTGIYGGRRIVYLPSFTPEEWVATAAAEAISHAMVVPTMLGRILDVLEAHHQTLPDLKLLSYGGGRMPHVVIERAMALLPGTDFVNAYGLTETSSTVAILNPDDHRAALASTEPHVRRRLGSVGRPLPSLELEIRDPEGKVLPAGQSGEVYLRGDQVSGEYLHKKAIQDDGWFATNDAGWVDEDGYLFVEGRLDDVIVRGGENISPGEIEDVLRTHPNVRDVAVFGLPDDQWGERVAAVVVTKDGTQDEAELVALVRGKLRSTRTPETWDFRAELPYNETGKLLRRVLKAELTRDVG